MSSPADCLFSESHEWYRVDGDVITVGISQFAANELTDITYVEMQPVGSTVSGGDSMGEVESVKTTSDVISAFNGEILEVNELVSDDPSLLNSEPFENGWLAKIKLSNPDPSENLMDQATYDGRYPA